MASGRKTAIIRPSRGCRQPSRGGPIWEMTSAAGRKFTFGPLPAESRRCGGSGGNVGDQLPLQHEDLVLEHQFSLFQSLELQFVVEGVEF